MKRKLIYGLLSALIAIGLWLYVVTVVNPEWEETFSNIPVVLENEEILHERGLMLVSEEDPKVTLRLFGNRADMIKLNSSNITIRADLSRIYSAGEQSLTYSIVYPGDVPNNAFEIVSQTPQQLTLSVVERKSKDVDVQVVFNGAVPEQYIAFMDKATLDFEKITVAGPASVVDRIVAAKVEVDLQDQKETISQQYSYVFCDAEGNAVESDWLKVHAEQVLYTLKIQQWKDIALRLDVVSGGGVLKEQCVVTPSVNIIRVSGSEKLLADLGDELLLGTIDLSRIDGNTVLSYNITLPEGITNLSEKNTVDVSVQIPSDMMTVEVPVTSIKAINIPNGMTVDISTTEKMVKVRGPQIFLDVLTSQDLEIYVDFANAEAGTATFAAKVIVVNPQLSAYLGAVGIYDVAATVTAVG